MKKKILICLLAIIALFTLTGCKNNKKTETKKDKELPIMENVEAKVGRYTITLDKTASFNGISFKYPSNAVSSNVGTYSIIDYMDGNNLVVRVATYFFDMKKPYEVMADSSLTETSTMSVNDKEWTVYEGVQDDKQVTTLVLYYNNSTYTITFLSDYNITEFMNTFIASIEYDF